MGRAGVGVLGVMGVAALSGCAGMLHVFTGLTPPRVQLRGVEVVQKPPPRDLEAALCPRVLRDGPAMLGSTSPTCTRVVGPMPRVNPTLTFDLALEVENQNYTALPISEILVGINLFPDETASSMASSWSGVSCMALCPSDNPFCWAEGEKRPCEGVRHGVPTEHDYAGARPDLITARGILLDRTKRPRMEQLTIPARSTVPIVARFSFVPGAIVEVLTESARSGGAAMRRGQPLPLSLPYEIDGAVYMTTSSGKRLGQAFGPRRGTWSLGGTVAIGD